MSLTPRPRLSIVRRGKPNFEDPGGATLRGGGNRNFQFYPRGGQDPSAHYGGGNRKFQFYPRGGPDPSAHYGVNATFDMSQFFLLHFFIEEFHHFDQTGTRI